MLCEHEKFETLIVKPHKDWNESYFVVHAFSRNPQNWAFHVLFTEAEDDENEVSWSHSHVKSLYFVIKYIVL